MLRDKSKTNQNSDWHVYLMACLQKALLEKRHLYERKTSIPHTEKKKRDDPIGGSGALEL